MLNTDFKKHDIEILEGYWYNYRKHLDNLRRRKFELLENKLHLPEEEQNKILEQDLYYRNCLNVTSSVEVVYNQADDHMKQFIMVRYWDKDTNLFEWSEVAQILHITKSKAYRMRRVLLAKTADEIGFIF